MAEAASQPALSPVDNGAAVGAAAKTASRPYPNRSGSGMNGPLYMQTSGSKVVLVRRLKRKEDGSVKQLMRWAMENQIGLSFNLLALLFLAHGFIPKARIYTQKFLYLSYFNPNSGKYATGMDDTYLIAYCVILFTGLRAWCMEYVLAPLAKRIGIAKRKDLTRFSEQGWSFIYYVVFWSLGMYIYVNSPFFLSMQNLWTDWPDREMTGLMKGYLLAQWAFWLHEIIVLNIEDRRKDHWQMFSHHITTLFLIAACYSYHFSRVGTLILISMDISDIFLPLAKCLKYAGYTTLCDVGFAAFMLSWLIPRHVFFPMTCWSIYTQLPRTVGTVCYKGTNDKLVGPFDIPDGWYYLIEPFLNSTGTICFDETIKWGFLGPLLFLLVLTVVWFGMIVRVALKVLRGDGAEDSRSDDEAEDEEEDEYVYEEAEALQEEVSAEALDLRNWERRTGVKRQGNSSGVGLPGHSDRKELLGRIGCEKQVD